VAAKPATVLTLNTARARRSDGWLPHPWLPEMVVTVTPGTASAAVRATAAGRYRAWVAGGFGRPLDVRVDGKEVGEAVGVNNLGQWLPAGEVALDRGSHRLRLRRPGGDLAPGDGYLGDLGPLALQLEGTSAVRRVKPERAQALCGKRWDWIERARL
jgi:hypothetical protein